MDKNVWEILSLHIYRKEYFHSKESYSMYDIYEVYVLPTE